MLCIQLFREFDLVHSFVQELGVNPNTIISYTKNLSEFFQNCYKSIWVVIEGNILFPELNTIS